MAWCRSASLTRSREAGRVAPPSSPHRRCCARLADDSLRSDPVPASADAGAKRKAAPAGQPPAKRVRGALDGSGRMCSTRSTFALACGQAPRLRSALQCVILSACNTARLAEILVARCVCHWPRTARTAHSRLTARARGVSYVLCWESVSSPSARAALVRTRTPLRGIVCDGIETHAAVMRPYLLRTRWRGSIWPWPSAATPTLQRRFIW
jgi:hypothetical protein